MVFVKVADVSDIPVGQGALREVGSVTVAVFNLGEGRFAASSPVCPHEDGPLSEGWIEGNAVVCPWHGFDFDVATGRCGVDAALTITVYPVRVRDGAVEVELP